MDKENILAEKLARIGLRSVEVVQEKDSIGTSFFFRINGHDVFAKGANYIPNDNFLPRVTKEDYEKVLNTAVESNMNMLRIWGGGIYENDEFYELCDEKGIMLWQDFMFVGNMYPDNSAFLQSIKTEAIQNVKRLRNHPSIVLWCGNNEKLTSAIKIFTNEKNLKLHTGKPEFEFSKTKDGYLLSFKSTSLIKGLQISCTEDGFFSDNYFDLLPGEYKVVLFETKSNSIVKNDFRFLYLSE